VEKSVKALKISYDGGKSYINPSVENAKNNTYPIIRPLQVYYLTRNEKVVSPFIQFLLSAEGQKTVETEGYIPLK
jgi:phosphate transport system substrate-binding protein